MSLSLAKQFAKNGSATPFLSFTISSFDLFHPSSFRLFFLSFQYSLEVGDLQENCGEDHQALLVGSRDPGLSHQRGPPMAVL